MPNYKVSIQTSTTTEYELKAKDIQHAAEKAKQLHLSVLKSEEGWVEKPFVTVRKIQEIA